MAALMSPFAVPITVSHSDLRYPVAAPRKGRKGTRIRGRRRKKERARDRGQRRIEGRGRAQRVPSSGNKPGLRVEPRVGGRALERQSMMLPSSRGQVFFKKAERRRERGRKKGKHYSPLALPGRPPSYSSSSSLSVSSASS